MVTMHKYVVERVLPGAHTLRPDEWTDFIVRSNEAVDLLSGRAQWLHSYVAEDKVLCVFIADMPETVIEHAKWANLPCDSVREVRCLLDPASDVEHP
jgi:hypothetical protein